MYYSRYSLTYLRTALLWRHQSLWAELKPWRILGDRIQKKLETMWSIFCDSFWWGKIFSKQLWLFWECNFPLYPKADSPRLKSAVQSGRSSKSSPGLDGEIGGENEALFLLQSKSWSREGSKSGVSSSSILQYLFRRSNQTGTSTHTHTHKSQCKTWKWRLKIS